MRLFLLLLLNSLLWQKAAAQQRPAQEDTIATRLQLPQADCALFPATARMSGVEEDSLPRSSRFTPTRAQVASVEKLLPTVRLQDIYNYSPTSYYAGYAATIQQNLPRYQRQYYGFYNAAHQPCLFINFFAERCMEVPGRPASWLCHRIFSFDGGAAFWHLYYNLTTHTFYDFSHGGAG